VNAFEGVESNLTIGQETYFSILTGNVNFPTAQIQLIKTGVTLNFTGYIGDDGTITLNLAPEVSDAIVSVNGNPTTNVRRVSTMVRIKPGETIAIGGLVQETTSFSKTKVPLLGDIPIIGELFSQRTNSTVKKEVLILITPYLTDSGVPAKGIDSNRKLPGIWDGP
jgi:type II secretory pathway component GspD/PulD (secretin)